MWSSLSATQVQSQMPFILASKPMYSRRKSFRERPRENIYNNPIDLANIEKYWELENDRVYWVQARH